MGWKSHWKKIIFTQTVGLLGRVNSPSQSPTYTQDNTKIEYTQTQTSMPPVGFKPTIPVFERAKTVHVLDLAATVIGYPRVYFTEYTLDVILFLLGTFS
jgi:hypothetical protein